MSTASATLLVVAVLTSAALVKQAGRLLRSIWRFRGTRLVVCPQTNAPAAVRVDAWSAAWAEMMRDQSIALADCSRWPARRFCRQTCLGHVKTDPDGSRVSAFVARWYGDKRCVYCGRSIPDAGLGWHHAALVDDDGATIEWSSVPPEELPDLLPTHAPACWDCHVAETFRRTHQQLTDRPSSRPS